MGKYIVFLLLIVMACAPKSFASGGDPERDRAGKKYDKLNAKALKARQRYLEVVNEKVSGKKLIKASRKMKEAEAELQKFKNGMVPDTRHRHNSH
jgi:hypothetical protein